MASPNDINSKVDGVIERLLAETGIEAGELAKLFQQRFKALREKGDDLGLAKAAKACRSGLRRKRGEVEHELMKAETARARYAMYVDQDDASWIDDLNDETAKSDALKAVLQRIDGKIAALDANPASQLLPVGTVVRLTSTPLGDPMRLGRYPEQHPVVGTEGVVIKAGSDGVGTLVIAIVDEFKDGHGQVWHPSGDMVWAWHVDREDVEVVAPGRFVDGSECEAYDFVPTHVHADKPKAEMLVEAKDHVWRLYLVDGQIYSPPTAYEDAERLRWLVDPRTGQTPAEAKAGASAPRP